MSGKKGMKKYPAETKLEAMRLFYEEGKTRAEITRQLDVRDPHRVKAWLKQYRREGAVGFGKAQGRPHKEGESEQAELERLRMENGLLKKFHTELRGVQLAQRNIGRSTTTRKNTK
jgi:transposase-like protein